MKRLLKIVLIVLALFFINRIIISNLNLLDNTQRNENNVSSDISSDDTIVSTAPIYNKKISDSLIASFFAVIQGTCLFLIQNSIQKRKNDNDNAPHIRISVNRVSGVHKNDTEKGIPKVKIHSEKNSEFIYVYAKLTNNGNKAISQCTIKKKNILNKDLKSEEELPFVFMIYQSSRTLLNRICLFNIRYSDQEDMKYSGLNIIVFNRKKTSATVKILFKQRRV